MLGQRRRPRRAERRGESRRDHQGGAARPRLSGDRSRLAEALGPRPAPAALPLRRRTRRGAASTRTGCGPTPRAADATRRPLLVHLPRAGRRAALRAGGAAAPASARRDRRRHAARGGAGAGAAAAARDRRVDAFLFELVTGHGLGWAYWFWHSTPARLHDAPAIAGRRGARSPARRAHGRRPPRGRARPAAGDARRSAGGLPLLERGEPRGQPPLRTCRTCPTAISSARSRSGGSATARRRGMKTIRARLVVLVATAAIAPLIAYGVRVDAAAALRHRAVGHRRGGGRRRARRPSRSTATSSHNLDLLKRVAADLQHTVARALAAGAHPAQLRRSPSPSSAS